MSCMPDMTPASFAVSVVPRTGKTIKNGLERRENLLQNGILYFVFPVTKLEFKQTKNALSERGLALKELIYLTLT